MGFLLCCNDACDIVMPQQPQFQMVAAFFYCFLSPYGEYFQHKLSIISLKS